MQNLDNVCMGHKKFVFERQILSKIFGTIQCKERWRIRSNKELQKSIKGANNVQYTKAQRIKQWGHLNRKEEIKLAKKTAEWNPIGVRTKDDQRTDEETQ
jgi:hypothetical protein